MNQEIQTKIIQIIEANDLHVDELHLFNDKDLGFLLKIHYTKPLLKPDLSNELKQIYKLGYYVEAVKSFDIDPKDTIRIWFAKRTEVY